MQYGVSLPPFGPFADAAELAALAEQAERAGWDGFFVWDHLVFDPSFHPIGNPWVQLAAVALRTRRIRIGTMITPLPRRRPWQLARETVTVDRLSEGRLILGVGIGDPAQWDYGFFGEEPDARIRAAKLNEGLSILTGLWTAEPFSFHGTHYQIEEVTFRPPPWQRPRIPIWVGGWWPNRPPMRRAARWDGMFPISDGGLTPEALAEAVGYVADHRRADGPFDVIASGATDGADPGAGAETVASYAAVGATWWLEDVSPWRFGADWGAPWSARDTDNMVARVRQGPPREPPRRSWGQRADALAADFIAHGKPTGWFDRLYAEGAAGIVAMPWDRTEPHPLLVDWARGTALDGTGRSAIVVGCGLGADAEFLASRGFATTAIDVSTTAIDLARSRNPARVVDYRVADLLALPPQLTGSFDLVVEIFTLQALPEPPRTAAAAAVASLVRPGGTLLVVAFRDEGGAAANDGPPYPLSEQFMLGLAAVGLELVSLEERDGSLWRAQYRG